MLSLSCKYIVVFVWIIPFEIVADPTEEKFSSKCSTERPGTFVNCSLDYMVLAMWCDRTNFDSVPHPKSPLIDTQTPAEKSKEIYLNDSCVRTLDRNILKHYRCLISLNLDDNELTSIQSKVFSSNVNMSNLVLSRNRITSLENNAFAGLTKLKILDLHSNLLTEIRRRVFSSLTKLETLNLSDNRLTDIDVQAFNFLHSLKHLNLAGNSLHRITPHHLSGLVQLRTLNLQRNNLLDPDKILFVSSIHLSSVDLSHNNISCLPKDIFKDKRELASVRLNNNQLTTARPEWLRSVLKNGNPDILKTNLLSGNPWLCDCSSSGYWNFLDSEVSDREWRDLLDIECSAPEHWNGRMISSLSNSDFAERLYCPFGGSNDDTECPEQSNIANGSPLLVTYVETDIVDNEDEITTSSLRLAVNVQTSKDSSYNEFGESQKHGSGQVVNPSGEKPPNERTMLSTEWIVIIVIGCVLFLTCTTLLSFKRFAIVRNKEETNSRKKETETTNDNQEVNPSKPTRSDSGFGDSQLISPQAISVSSEIGYNSSSFTSGDITRDSAWKKFGRSRSFDQSHTEPKAVVGHPHARPRHDSGCYSNPDQFEPLLEPIHEDNQRTDHIYNHIPFPFTRHNTVPAFPVSPGPPIAPSHQPYHPYSEIETESNPFVGRLSHYPKQSYPRQGNEKVSQSNGFSHNNHILYDENMQATYPVNMEMPQNNRFPQSNGFPYTNPILYDENSQAIDYPVHMKIRT